MHRYLSLDLLRIIGSLAVIVLHVKSATSASYGHIPDTEWWISNFFTTISRWAVPVFLIISGITVTLSPPKSYRHFIQKKIIRVGIPLFFWVIAYAVFNHFFFRHDPLSISFVMHRFIFDQTYEHLYFLVLLLQMALFAPLMYLTVKQLSLTKSLSVFFLLVLIAVLYRENRFIGTLFIPYLFYFYGGVVAGKYMLNKTLKPVATTFLLGTFVGSMVLILLGTHALVSNPFRTIPNGLYFYTNINPAVAFVAFSLTLLFWGNELHLRKKLSTKATQVITTLTPLTYGVYLFHAMPLSFLQHTTNSHLLQFIGTTIVSFGFVKLVKDQKFSLLRYFL